MQRAVAEALRYAQEYSKSKPRFCHLIIFAGCLRKFTEAAHHKQELPTKKSQHSKFSKPSKPVAAVELTVWSARKTALKFLKMGVPNQPRGSKTDRPPGIGSVQYPFSWRPEDAAYFEKHEASNYGVTSGAKFCIVCTDGSAGIAAFRDLASRNESRIPKTVSWKLDDHRYYLFLTPITPFLRLHGSRGRGRVGRHGRVCPGAWQ